MVQAGKGGPEKGKAQVLDYGVTVTVPCVQQEPPVKKPSTALYKCGVFASCLLVLCSIVLSTLSIHWVYSHLHSFDDVTNGTGFPGN